MEEWSFAKEIGKIYRSDPAYDKTVDDNFRELTESYNDEWILIKPKPETQPFFFKLKRRPLWKNLLKSRSSYLKKL